MCFTTIAKSLDKTQGREKKPSQLDIPIIVPNTQLSSLSENVVDLTDDVLPTYYV